MTDSTEALRERAEDLYAELLADGAVEGVEQLDELADGDAALARVLRDVHAHYGRAAAALGGASGESGTLDLVQHLASSGERETYRRLAAVARGGMGEILEVRDLKLRRNLAMKVLPAEPDGRESSSAGRRRVRRFLEEAEITGRLEHPGIVPVHDLGLDGEGRLFFTMPLVRGRNLREIIDLVGAPGEDWSMGRALGVVLRVCEAMAYAHAQGVVHRDLKPANVMVGEFGETYVMDWGLAKRVRDDEGDDEAPGAGAPDAALATMDGDVVGTPAYMAPEQARGELDSVGTRSDVYSVGALLYHLLAGEPPYAGATEAVEVLGRVRGGPPRSLDQVRPRLAPELIAICEKAMAREPDARYGGMKELASDLQAHLDSRVVTAYDTGLLESAKKWVVRNPATTAAILAVAIGLAAVLVVQAHANRELSASNDDLRRAEYFNNVALAASAFEGFNTAGMHELLARCDPDLRSFEWHWLDRLTDSSLATIEAHPDGGATLDWLPDGRLVTGGWDRRVLVHDLAGGPPLVLEGHREIVDAVAASPDGAWVASASRDGEVRVWSARDGAPARTLRPSATVGAVAFSPDGARLAVGGDGGDVLLYRVGTWEPLERWNEPIGGVQAVTFSPDGRRLAALGRSGEARVLDAATGRRELGFPAHATFGKALAFDAEGGWLLTGGGDRAARLWDAHTGEPERWFFSRRGGARGVAFLPDGRTVATTEFANIRFWDLATGGSRGHVAGHLEDVIALRVSRDGRTLASGDRAGVVKLWALPPPDGCVELAGHTDFVYPVAFVPGAGLVASGARDGTVRVWDPPTGSEVARLGEDLPWVLSLAVSPDGGSLYAGYRDGVVRTWTMPGRDLGHSFRAHSGWVRSISLGGSGTRMLTSGADGRARLWDVASGRELASFVAGAEAGETWSALDPAARYAATGSWSGRLRIWDAATGEPLHEARYDTPVQALAFSPGGEHLAVGGGWRTVDVLDVASGDLRFSSPGHEAGVQALAYTPGGERLVSAGYDGLVKVWDAETGRTALTLHGDESALSGLAVAPDGRSLAAGGVGKTIFVWSVGER